MCFAVPVALRAQVPVSGIVRGTVTDPDAAIIPGAAITLTSSGGNDIAAKSGSDGTFRIPVPPGAYTVSITMPGFAPYSRPSLKVAAGQSIALDAKLIVGDETTTINVTSEVASVGVDADQNASATIIKGKDLEALSDDPDELSSELSALAGPSAGPSGGQIYVDGFTGGQLPPKSSIREIRINQNPFSAQYDKLGYGRVEVFTKPGTDKFHGSLSTQGNTKGLNTSNPFLGATDAQPGYYTFFLLGNITGPLTKTSSFSVGASRRNINTNTIINPTAIYAASAGSTQLCQPLDLTCGSFAFPAASRAVLQPQLRQDITPRVDFALGASNVLTIRYQYEGGSRQNGGIGANTLPTAASNTSNSENTIQISDTQTISAKMVNETRLEYQRGSSQATPLSTAPTVSVQGAFTGGGSGGQTSSSVNTHIEIQNYTSIAMAKNFVRFGGRLRTTSESLTSTAGSNGGFTYTYLLDPCTDPGLDGQNGHPARPSGCATGVTRVCDPANTTASTSYFSSYQCGLPSQFRLTTINKGTVKARSTDVGLYVEDDWKIKPNLTFSYGLRFETQNAIHSGHDLAPRLSIAYGIPRAGGRQALTVLRGGFGIFYDRFGLGDLLTLQQLSASGPAQTQTTVLNPGLSCQPTGTSPFTCGTGATNKSTVYSMAGNLRSAYTMQGALGLDQQLGRIGTVSLNYVASRGNHEFFTRLTPTGAAYDYQLQSGGVFNQQQFFVNANVRTRAITLFGFYALGFANSNTSGSGFIPTSTNSRVDYGRAPFNTRSSAVIGGNYMAPFRISASPFLSVRSGSPYNITTGTDVNGDTAFNDRPAFASGSSADCRVASTFTTPAPGSSYAEIPINYCTGPASFGLNLRLSRAFGFGPRREGATTVANAGGLNGASGGGRPGRAGGAGGGGRGGGGMMSGRRGGGSANSGRRYNLNLGAQAQNLFNIVTYSAPVGTLSNARFGTFTSIQGNGTAVRSITLQATLNF
jgi:hypothetical protein